MRWASQAGALIAVSHDATDWRASDCAMALVQRRSRETCTRGRAARARRRSTGNPADIDCIFQAAARVDAVVAEAAPIRRHEPQPELARERHERRLRRLDEVRAAFAVLSSR